MYPSEWIPGASIFKRGAGANIFEACLGPAEGTVVFHIGNQNIQLQSDQFSVAAWSQLTFMVDGSNITSYVNGVHPTNPVE